LHRQVLLDAGDADVPIRRESYRQPAVTRLCRRSLIRRSFCMATSSMTSQLAWASKMNWDSVWTLGMIHLWSRPQGPQRRISKAP